MKSALQACWSRAACDGPQDSPCWVTCIELGRSDSDSQHFGVGLFRTEGSSIDTRDRCGRRSPGRSSRRAQPAVTRRSAMVTKRKKTCTTGHGSVCMAHGDIILGQGFQRDEDGAGCGKDFETCRSRHEVYQHRNYHVDCVYHLGGH